MINPFKTKKGTRTHKGSITGGLLIMVYVFLVLFPTMLLLSSIWSQAQPILTSNTINPYLNSTDANSITQLGNNFFYYSSDSIIVIFYFALVAALFISAIYEQARPETLPLGLLFLIPLILITFPLADLAHYFYTNPGFANVAGFYGSTEYLADNSPTITILVTIIYLVLVITKKQLGLGNGGSGPSSNIISG